MAAVDNEVEAAPAHNEDAERIVLGALMLNAGLVAEVRAVLTAADFYNPHHGAIYSSIIANAATDSPTDPVAMAATLRKTGDLHRIHGGADYLHTLIRSVPVVVSAPWYAGLVAEAAFARRAEVAAIRVQHAARTGSRESIAAAYDKLQQDMATSASGGADAWRSRLTNGATFIYDVPDKVPAVWGEGDDVLWAAGEALMICGPQGVGKTTLAGQIIAARLGLLPEVLGWPVVPGARRVLYLAMDRPQQAARALQRLMHPDWRNTLRDRLHVWQGPPPEDLAASPSTLVEMCRAADADTVIVDSLKDAAVGLSKDEGGAGYNRARQLAIGAGVEVLELHHQRKATSDGGKPNTLADVYGSTWLPSGAGSVLLLWGQAGDPMVDLYHLKQPRADVGPLTVVHDHAAGTSRIDRGDLTQDLLYLTPRQPHGMTPKLAARAMFQSDSPDRNMIEKARYRLERYVKDGLMVRREGTRGGVDGGTETAYFLVERREDDQ